MDTPGAQNWARASPKVTLEISNYIIRYLAEYLPALRVCSLVCREWLPASRKIMHRDLLLHNENIASFPQLLESPLNTFFDAVRTMYLSLDHDGSETRAVLESLPQFTHLDSLSLDSGCLSHGLPASPRISTLELSDVEFPSFVAFLDLLSQFSGLKSLTLGHLEFPGGSRKPKIPRKTAPFPGLSLETFSVDVSDNNQLLHWLASSTAAGHCQISTPRLILTGFDDISSTRISGYLHTLGTNLKHLSLPPVMSQTDFTANTALQSLSLSHALWIYSDWSLSVFPRIPSTLGQFEHLDGQLEEVILAVKSLPFSPRQEDLRTRPDLFAQLAAELSRPQYARVPNIRLHATWREAPDGFSRELFAAALQKVLPHHAARFVFVD
ncbi:hypothetical protein B0H11DRAFT_2267854 [Mycena galericulata]|nr:hypothetical protein B0H11DRAFT_2267854 [Mycena galericulata]